MNSALRRLLVPLLRSVQAGKVPSFRMKSAAQQALFMVQRKPSPSRKGPAKARKEVKRALHREETGAIREAVFQRLGWACELGAHYSPNEGLEMHHLEGGSTRRSLQAVSNCIRACGVCHRAYHHRPEDFRIPVLAWCAWHGYPIPRRFLRPAPAAAPNPPRGGSGAGQEEV